MVICQSTEEDADESREKEPPTKKRIGCVEARPDVGGAVRASSKEGRSDMVAFTALFQRVWWCFVSLLAAYDPMEL